MPVSAAGFAARPGAAAAFANEGEKASSDATTAAGARTLNIGDFPFPKVIAAAGEALQLAHGKPPDPAKVP